MSNRIKFERSYRDTIPILGVLTKVLSNRTKATRVHGILSFSCEICGLAFTKPAAWAKRSNHHYCSRACASEAKRKPRIIKLCIVCAKEFSVSPWQDERYVTCGRECLGMSRKETTFVNGLVSMAMAQPKNSVAFACKTCAKIYYRWPSWLKRRKSSYCSRACHNISKRGSPVKGSGVCVREKPNQRPW